MKLLCAVVFAISMCACGQGPAGPQGPAAALQNPTTTAIQDVLENGAHGNAYRLGLGETELSPGLSCTVAIITSGNCLNNSSASNNGCAGGTLISTSGQITYSYLYQGTFDEPDANNGVSSLIPTDLQQIFVNQNYKIVCTGYMVVTSPGWVEVADQSDDGSIFSTDTGSTLYNDGTHSENTTPLTQSYYLSEDVHSITIQYAQSSGGAFGFLLTQNGAAFNSAAFYH